MNSSQKQNLVQVCSGCNAVLVRETWLELPDLEIPDTQITHGLCPDCYKAAAGTLSELVARSRSASVQLPEKTA